MSKDPWSTLLALGRTRRPGTLGPDSDSGPDLDLIHAPDSGLPASGRREEPQAARQEQDATVRDFAVRASQSL